MARGGVGDRGALLCGGLRRRWFIRPPPPPGPPSRGRERRGASIGGGGAPRFVWRGSIARRGGRWSILFWRRSAGFALIVDAGLGFFQNAIDWGFSFFVVVAGGGGGGLRITPQIGGGPVGSRWRRIGCRRLVGRSGLPYGRGRGDRGGGSDHAGLLKGHLGLELRFTEDGRVGDADVVSLEIAGPLGPDRLSQTAGSAAGKKRALCKVAQAAHDVPLFRRECRRSSSNARIWVRAFSL